MKGAKPMASGTQLALFNASAVAATSYKVGDRVKLRKRPMAASYLKKGDIVEVAALHPIDNSIKFWNERSECWEFIYPDEVARVFDSVTPAEVAVTESTVQPDDSVTPVEVAVTESTVQPDDSVTPAEVAVTESTVQPDDSVTSAEVAVTESTVQPDDSLFNAISSYKPCGTARGGLYFRLSYREGNRVRHQHIRGGNTDSPIAQAKVQEVRSLLAAGMSPAQVAGMLRRETQN